MYQPFNIYYDIYSDNASPLPNLFTLRVQQCRYYPSWTWHPQHDSRLVRFGSLLFTSRLLGCQRLNGWMDGSGGAAKAVGARGCLWLDWHASCSRGDPQLPPTHPQSHSLEHILDMLCDKQLIACSSCLMSCMFVSGMIYVRNWISWLFLRRGRWGAPTRGRWSWPKEAQHKLAHFPVHLPHVLVSIQSKEPQVIEPPSSQFSDLVTGGVHWAADVCILHYSSSVCP